jgi:hypothetical protein
MDKVEGNKHYKRRLAEWLDIINTYSSKLLE